jgi:NTP pyrophosphatase (non-canonical NTP hydrolase)
MKERTLPMGDSWTEKAVRSVYRRGFYGGFPHLAGEPQLMAQFIRLSEEVGEEERARLQMSHTPSHHTAGALAEELADVAIVLAQIAWLTGMEAGVAEAVSHSIRTIEGTTLPAELGELGRALRKAEPGRYEPVHLRIVRMAALCRILASQRGYNLEDLILRKLAQDEERGQLHGHLPAGWVVQAEVA